MNVEIPGGASVTSKSPRRMLTELRSVASQGCKIQLQDGNWYTDWQMGLHGIFYGYAPGWWREALTRAIHDGPASSIAHRDEHLLANALGEFYPDIEAARFYANGSDPCAASVKLARAATGRDGLLVYGYHGTSPAFASPPTPFDPDDNRQGTLQADRDNYVSLSWLGDIPTSLYDIAAVIIECPPIDGGKTQAAKWLQRLARKSRADGALFVLDEVVTGLRYGPGGAAEYYGIQGLVDLYCFGKTIGNGYPVSALAGKKHAMDWLVDKPGGGGKVHWSGTWAGEPFGLAAALATLERVRTEPPWDYMIDMGTLLKQKWNALDLPWKLRGHPTRPVLVGDDPRLDDLRRYLFRYRHIVCKHPWYATVAHTQSDIVALVEAAREWAATHSVGGWSVIA